MKDKSRTILRVLIFCILSGVVLGALFIGVLWVKMDRDDRIARVEIQKRIEAIRQAGQPLTAQGLAKLYPDPPPEHDAVLLLKPALAALVVPKDPTNLPFFSEENWPEGTAPLARPMLDEIQDWMGKNQKALDSIPLEKLKSAWIGCSFTNGFTNLVYAPVSEIDSLVKLLCLNAALQAEFQHPGQAIQSLQKAAFIGKSWRNDMPIHGFAKIATQGWVCGTLNRVLDRSLIADSDLASISDSLTLTNLGTSKEFMINECCEGLFYAKQTQALAKQSKIHTISPVRWLLKSYQAEIIYRDQDLLNCLIWDQRCLAAMDLPLSNAVPTLQTLERNAANVRKREHVNFLNAFKKERNSILTDFFEPQMCRIFLAEASTVAQVRVTRIALAIERWRLAHNGSVPVSLAELVPDFLPAVTQDPFDDQPLRFKKLARGYVVYSVGPDFTDDGGRKKAADAGESDHYDITFTIER